MLSSYKAKAKTSPPIAPKTPACIADAAPVLVAGVAEAVPEAFEAPDDAAAPEAELDDEGVEEAVRDAIETVEFEELIGARDAVPIEPGADDVPEAPAVLVAIAVADETRDAADEATDETTAAGEVAADEAA